LQAEVPLSLLSHEPLSTAVKAAVDQLEVLETAEHPTTTSASPVFDLASSSSNNQYHTPTRLVGVVGTQLEPSREFKYLTSIFGTSNSPIRDAFNRTSGQ
jgi:hypothetical protein